MNTTSRRFEDCLLPSSNKNAAIDEMLLSSFFLPADVIAKLKANGCVIHPVQVVSNEDFWKAEPYLADKAVQGISYSPNKELVKAAKWIGVSIRTHGAHTFVIAKLWQQDETTPVKGSNHGI